MKVSFGANRRPAPERFRVLVKGSFMAAQCIANQKPFAKFGIVPAVDIATNHMCKKCGLDLPAVEIEFSWILRSNVASGSGLPNR